MINMAQNGLPLSCYMNVTVWFLKWQKNENSHYCLSWRVAINKLDDLVPLHVNTFKAANEIYFP